MSNTKICREPIFLIGNGCVKNGLLTNTLNISKEFYKNLIGQSTQINQFGYLQWYRCEKTLCARNNLALYSVDKS